MKHSCLFYNSYKNGIIGNMFKTSLYNDDQMMNINNGEDLENLKYIGINCFEEILSYSDFYSFKK